MNNTENIMYCKFGNGNNRVSFSRKVSNQQHHAHVAEGNVTNTTQSMQ